MHGFPLRACAPARRDRGDDGCEADGTSVGRTAVVIESAKASEVAPIIVEAYGLCPREREIVELIARGLPTAQIARSLLLSPHTLRDYVKSTFDKVGVSSRGELVARLFGEHYQRPLRDSLSAAA